MNFERERGAKDNISAPSSFDENAHVMN